jgi:hypothetical protein
VDTPKSMGKSAVDARPVRMLSGDYHRMVNKNAGAFGGSRTHTVIPWSGNDSGDGIPSSPDALEFRYPYTQELLQPNWIRKRGSFRTVRTLCESGVRIKVLESGFGNPNSDAFALLLVQFADPGYVRIRNYLHFAFR